MKFSLPPSIKLVDFIYLFRDNIFHINHGFKYFNKKEIFEKFTSLKETLKGGRSFIKHCKHIHLTYLYPISHPISDGSLLHRKIKYKVYE